MDFEVLGRTLPGIETLEPLDEESCRLSVACRASPATTGRCAWSRSSRSTAIACAEAKGDSAGSRVTRSSARRCRQANPVSSTMNIRRRRPQRRRPAVHAGDRESMIRDFLSAFGAELGGQNLSGRPDLDDHGARHPDLRGGRHAEWRASASRCRCPGLAARVRLGGRAASGSASWHASAAAASGRTGSATSLSSAHASRRAGTRATAPCASSGEGLDQRAVVCEISSARAGMSVGRARPGRGRSTPRAAAGTGRRTGDRERIDHLFTDDLDRPPGSPFAAASRIADASRWNP